MNERKFNQSARYLSTCRSENGQLPSSNEYVLVDTLTAVITSRFDTMKGTHIHTYIQCHARPDVVNAADIGCDTWLYYYHYGDSNYVTQDSSGCSEPLSLNSLLTLSESEALDPCF